MTALPRASEQITVPVALGARAYDIVIGRGLLASARRADRGAAAGLRKLAIVTDDTRGRAPSRRRRGRAGKSAGIASRAIVVPAGEGSKSFATFETVCEAIDRRAHRARRSGGRARRRRDRRSCRLCRGERAARARFRAGADHAAGAGRFLGRRQDRHQFPPRQESRRRLPSADPGGRRHRAARHACRRASSAPAMPRSPNTACSATPSFSPGSRPTGGTCSPAAISAREHAIAVCCRGKAGIVARDERETGERALLNLGHTFGHAFEAGCGFSGRLLHGEAVALGMALAFEFSARQGPVGAADAGARARSSCGGRPAHPSQGGARRRAGRRRV